MADATRTKTKKRKKSKCSEAQLAANLRNSRMSTGPRSPEGKDRAKFNNLRHNCYAEHLVLPGEDGELLRARINSLILELGADTELERQLAERAAQLQWKLERAHFADVQILSQRILAIDEGYDAALADHVERAIAELLEHPADSLRALRGTAGGCQWLIQQWTLLQTWLRTHPFLEPGQNQIAVALLGYTLMDLISEPAVRDWMVHSLGATMGDEVPDVEGMAGQLGNSQPSFMADDEFLIHVEDLAGRRPGHEAGYAWLMEKIESEQARLRADLGWLGERDRRDRALAAGAARVDDSATGARRVRQELSYERAMHATLRQLREVQDRRREAEQCPEEEAAEGSGDVGGDAAAAAEG